MRLKIERAHHSPREEMIAPPSAVIPHARHADSMDLSVVVVSWNTRDLLRQCLESIDETVDNLEREVIVVDNASTDGSAEMVAEAFPRTGLIRNSDNRGFAAANNQAIAVAQGRHVLLLNSDAVLLPGAARHLAEFLDSHPRVAVVGPQVLNPDLSYQGSYADFPTFLGEVLLLTDLARFVYGSNYPSPAPEEGVSARLVDWVSGACFMVRRAAIDDVGALDEDYFMYSEETDWCFRMRRTGWEVAFLPSARAIHHSGSSSRRAPVRRRTQIYRSKWLFMRKHYGRRPAASFRLLVRVISALKLGIWLSAAIGPDPARREVARNQVASYRFLLAHF